MKIEAVICTLIGVVLAEPDINYQSQPGLNTLGSSGYGQQNQPSYGTQGSSGYGQPNQPNYNTFGSSGYGQPNQPSYNTSGSSGYGQPNQPSYNSFGSSGYSQPNQPYNTLGGSGYGQSSGYSGTSFQGGSQQSYSTNSNLRQIIQQLENDLSRDLQQSIQNKYRQSSAYSNNISPSQIDQDKRTLEQELRTDIPTKIDEAIRARYGVQGVRGSMSYSIVNGRFQPNANYDIQELTQLTRQTENNLLRQLEEGIQRYYHTSSQQGGNQYPTYTTQTPRLYPTLPSQPTSDSATAVTARVQSNLNQHLTRILEETQRRYFSSRPSGRPIAYNWDSILSQLQRDFRNNITSQVNDEIRRTYGNTNYHAAEFENFKRVTEQALIERLTREFNQQKVRYLQGNQGGINSGYSPTGYQNANLGPNQIDWSLIKREVQQELSTQLQTVIAQQRRLPSTYSTSTGYGSQGNSQVVLQRLTAELNQNVTRLLEQKLHQHSSGRQNSEGNVELANVKSQLQTELVRQLQQGLQQPSSNYGSSNPSSNIYGSYGNYGTNYRQRRSIDVKNHFFYNSRPEFGSYPQENENPKNYLVASFIKRQLDTPEVPKEETMKLNDSITQVNRKRRGDHTKISFISQAVRGSGKTLTIYNNTENTKGSEIIDGGSVKQTSPHVPEQKVIRGRWVFQSAGFLRSSADYSKSIPDKNYTDLSQNNNKLNSSEDAAVNIVQKSVDIVLEPKTLVNESYDVGLKPVEVLSEQNFKDTNSIQHEFNDSVVDDQISKRDRRYSTTNFVHYSLFNESGGRFRDENSEEEESISADQMVYSKQLEDEDSVQEIPNEDLMQIREKVNYGKILAVSRNDNRLQGHTPNNHGVDNGLVGQSQE